MCIRAITSLVTEGARLPTIIAATGSNSYTGILPSAIRRAILSLTSTTITTILIR